MTSLRERRAPGFSLGAAVWVTALFLLLFNPAHLAGESDQIRAVKEHRASRIHSWLLARDGRNDTAGDLARSILRESEKNSLDPVLILAIIQVESQFDHKAISSQGAEGLMQIRSVVVTELVEEGKIPAARHHNLRDPLVNVRVGASYLAHLIDMFGDLKIALAAYNWGPTRIRKKLVAKEAIPSQYASKVLRARRALGVQLALGTKIVEERDSSGAVEAG
jgi:soluble lytic murein transglycosylase-like protein